METPKLRLMPIILDQAQEDRWKNLIFATNIYLSFRYLTFNFGGEYSSTSFTPIIAKRDIALIITIMNISRCFSTVKLNYI